jgi:hypothetical protein
MKLISLNLFLIYHSPTVLSGMLPAHTATEHLVPMFYGADKQKPWLDNFNFFALQLWICIEMAFGMMQKKWGILWHPLLVPLDKTKYIIEVIARLHNFCINERLLEAGDEIDPVTEANITGRGTFEESAAMLAEYEAVLEDLPGYSGNREHMVKHIKKLGLARVTLR